MTSIGTTGMIVRRRTPAETDLNRINPRAEGRIEGRHQQSPFAISMPLCRGNPMRQLGLHFVGNKIEALFVGDTIPQFEKTGVQAFVLVMQAVNHARSIGVLVTDVGEIAPLVFVLEFVGQQIQQLIQNGQQSTACFVIRR